MLIIDSNYICQRARYTVGDLDSEEAGIIFGFLKDILYVSYEFKTNKLIFTWDSKKSKRRDTFPKYKNKRREKTEEEKEQDKIAYHQFFMIRSYVLKQIGFKNILLFSGYEADDVIAKILFNWASIRKKINEKDKPIVVSSDNDLYQLLIFCHLYNPQKKKLYTEEDFRMEYELNPQAWADVKAISGCNTDCVPGIKGIGYKTAAKFINGKINSKSKACEKIIKEFQTVYERNIKLVRLPFDDNLDIVLKEDDLNLDNFIDICEEYNFRSFLRGELLKKWKGFFNGIFS